MSTITQAINGDAWFVPPRNQTIGGDAWFVPPTQHAIDADAWFVHQNGISADAFFFRETIVDPSGPQPQFPSIYPPTPTTKRACSVSIECPGVDDPVLNLSSEAPDNIIFTGIGYTPFDPFKPPIIGKPTQVFTAASCYGTATSTISQEIADLVAKLESALCAGAKYVNTTQTATAFCSNGFPFTFTVPAGWFAGNSQNEADLFALAYGLQQASRNAICMNVRTQSGWVCLDEPLALELNTYEITGRGASSTYEFSIIAGSLPPGVDLVIGTHNNAFLDGIPTTPGIYNWSVLANSHGYWNYTINDTMAVFGITNPNLPDATVLVPYSEHLLDAGGTAPITYSVDPAEIPSWVSVSSGGLVTGTPQLSDDGIQFSFDVTITDADGAECTQTVTITVGSITVTPSIAGGITAWFGGGQEFTSGRYRISYVNGALKYNPFYPGWSLNLIAPYIGWYNVEYDGGGGTVKFPGDGPFEANQAAVEATFAGAYIDVVHTVGQIGVRLYDTIYGDNVPGSPNPTFRLVRL